MGGIPKADENCIQNFESVSIRSCESNTEGGEGLEEAMTDASDRQSKKILGRGIDPRQLVGPVKLKAYRSTSNPHHAYSSLLADRALCESSNQPMSFLSHIAHAAVISLFFSLSLSLL